jgi:Arc/MetJ family transcription regulator
MTMRTNIVLDDRLVKEAMKLGGIQTKREIVDLALREFVTSRKRLDLRALRSSGLIDEAYDYKSLRAGKAR